MGQSNSVIPKCIHKKRNIIYHVKCPTESYLVKKFSEPMQYSKESYILKDLCQEKSLKNHIICPKNTYRSTIVYPYLDEYLDLFELHRDLTIEEKQKIFHEIVFIIMRLHHLGIEHHDIKPENILVHRKNLHCKIIDFEMARYEWEIIQKHYFGTKYYLPPESLFDNLFHEFGKKDVWALGILYIFLFHQDLPIQENLEIEYKMLMKEKINYPYFVQKCLCIQPQHRIRSNFLYLMLSS